MEHIKNGYPEPTDLYLEPTEFLDWDKTAVKEFAYKHVEGAKTDREKCVQLFYAVRDLIRYDPYRVSLDRQVYHASNLLMEGAGFCLPKANLLAAAARAVGIPAGIGLADVVNHLTTERLLEKMGGETVFYHHGYAVLYIDGHWRKAAAAFNLKLCERFGVKPTEFDGSSDALFQEYDTRNQRHMEYLAVHGIWSDFPFDMVAKDFKEAYPASFFTKKGKLDAKAAFENEKASK